MTLENGHLLNNRYRILDILGQGNMGVVYRAVDEKLDISVVIKESVYLSKDVALQFQQKARDSASLRHPNLARVFDYFVIEGQGQYLVGEHIEGGDLGQWMARPEGLTEMEALQIGIAICNALIYLHSNEPAITHCGIKPENIKFTPFSEIILVDLSLAKTCQPDAGTAIDNLAPTPGFSPPELIGEGLPDHRSDIFSLGATLFAALAGYPPESSLDRVTGKTELSPLRSYQPHLSRQTTQVIEKALNLRYEDRWQSAVEFKDALIKARGTLPAEKQKDTRLAVFEPRETGKPSRKIRITRDSPLMARVRGLTRSDQRDPVWFIYAAIILLLVLFLSVALIRPQALRDIFLAGLRAPHTQDTANDPSQAEDLSEVPRDADAQQAITPCPIIDPVAADTANVSLDPTPTPTGGGAGLLAYVSDASGRLQIWLLDVTSQETTQLTDLKDGACQPDWSPDGKHIVFTSPCTAQRTSYPGSRLMIIDLASGDLTSLPASLEGDFDPAWSPNGVWIAYTTLINGRAQLAKINLYEQTSIRLSDGNYPDSSPAWSPDGEQLAFVRLRGVPQIWLMDADGENQVQFTLSGTIDNSNPTWYLDGQMILFSQSLGTGSPSKQLYGMRLEDIGQTEEYAIIPRMRLDYIPLMDHVDVSPDGFWLAFDYWYFDVLPDIYMMSFPGANLIQLTDHPGLDYDPAWSPQP
jgi:serine/threonine protein kinase/Tol biopolymer transport system component